MEVKRKITVQSLFVRFLLWFCGLTIGTLLFWIVVFGIMNAANVVLPANYGETILEKNRTEFETAEKVTEEMIPAGCSYGVFNPDGVYLYGDLDEEVQEKLWAEYEREGSGSVSMGNLKYFQREEGVCIAAYYLKPLFVNPVLRKWLPGVQETLGLLFLLCFFLESAFLVRKFGRTIRTELERVQQVTEKVRQENLEFEKPVTKLREVDEVMDSLVQLRDALEVSLKKQWKMEEERRQQMRALIHDIKTPLTVIRGNAQLIEESNSETERMECQEYILQETDRIEGYIRILQEMMKSEELPSFHVETINLNMLTKEFTDQAKLLASAKKQKLEFAIEDISGSFCSDRQLFQRALENLLSNALEYTPEEGNIFIAMWENEHRLCVCIEDDGSGFTEEDLQRGKEQFYQGDKSRNANNHYGMGLFMVQSFVNQQGGCLVLENSSKLGGARVCLELNIVPKTSKMH